MIIRKIDGINKWDNPKNVDRPDATIPGDTISDLRTKGNKLSVWLANTKEDVEDAVVALSLSRDDPKKLVMVILDEQELKGIDISVRADQLGDAQGASETILHKHRNLVELDYKRLGFLAEYMLEKAKDENNRRIYTESQVRAILNKYKDEDKIDATKVKQSIANKLNWGEDGNA